ncbi:hypothetical protein [Spirochaeta isovalerica]|nr:hypothetical protein [Spirochaeta isovalerica]
MGFSISNASETPVNTGLKILLDTVFEAENRFLFSEDEIQNYVNSEYEVESSKSFDYCISGLIDRDRKKALMVLVQNTSPDKIVAANWSRLNEADFQYRANIGRSFTSAPYSKNDSAIMFLYFPRNLLPGNTLAVSLILRAVDTADSQDSVSINLKDESPESTETQTISTTVNEVETSEASETLQQNQRGGKKTFLVQSLVKIKQIRDIIDSLSNPGMLTDSTLDYLEKLMEELEKLNADESAE